MKTQFTSKFAFAAVFATALVASAPGAIASPGHDSKTKPDIGTLGKASAASRTIEVKMYDNYYAPERISVKKGETVRFVIKNVGDLVHEFSIGTPAMHMGHQKEMETMMEHGILEADKINRGMMKMDMGNGKTMDHNDPNSVLLEPGEEKEIIWKFSTPKNLEFACNVPGHYDAGMVGKLSAK